MRQFVLSLPVVAVVGVVVFAAVTLKSQDNVPAQPEVWEYATVIGSGNAFLLDGPNTRVKGSAQICFVSVQGCRYESPIEVNTTFATGTQSTPAYDYNQAFAKASFRLGAEGWELTNTLGVNQDGGTGQIQMYFRRPLSHR